MLIVYISGTKINGDMIDQIGLFLSWSFSEIWGFQFDENLDYDLFYLPST
jgi:hypothetical protein